MFLGNEKALLLLFVAGFVLVPIYVWAFWRKATALNLLASKDLLKKINPSVSISRQIFKAFLMLLAFVSVAIALTEPKWNPHSRNVRSMGRDVVILLDTSRSMLAEDVRPSRLARAKLAITDLIEVLRGDRIALVTFAGNSTIKCPLTQDYAFMRMALSEVTTESTSLGGTNIGDAIRKAIDEVFDKTEGKYKDIILITDGQDDPDYNSFPVQAAEKAAGQNIRIIAFGLGDEDQGARIPILGSGGQKTFLKYQGQEVWTKLQAKTLRDIVYATANGKYLSVKPGQTFDLDQVYLDMVASAQKRELESVAMMQYDEKFQIFLALAIFLIVCEALVSERKKT